MRPAGRGRLGSACSQQIEGAVKGALNTTYMARVRHARAGLRGVVNVGTNLFQNPVVPLPRLHGGQGGVAVAYAHGGERPGPDGITVNMVSGGLPRTHRRQLRHARGGVPT